MNPNERVRRLIAELGGTKWMSEPIAKPAWLAEPLPTDHGFAKESDEALELYERLNPYLVAIASGISHRTALLMRHEVDSISQEVDKDLDRRRQRGGSIDNDHVFKRVQLYFMLKLETVGDAVVDDLRQHPFAGPYVERMSATRALLNELSSHSPVLGSDKAVLHAGANLQAKLGTLLIREARKQCALQYAALSGEEVAEVAKRSAGILLALAVSQDRNSEFVSHYIVPGDPVRSSMHSFRSHPVHLVGTPGKDLRLDFVKPFLLMPLPLYGTVGNVQPVVAYSRCPASHDAERTHQPGARRPSVGEDASAAVAIEVQHAVLTDVALNVGALGRDPALNRACEMEIGV